MLRAVCVLWLVSLLSISGGAAAPDPAQRRKAKAPAAKVAKPTASVSKDVACPSDLGVGVKSQRRFCDITVGTDPAKGIVMRVPPHTGPTTLLFDLHNRFAVSGPKLPFARAVALVAVLNGSSGAVIGRAGVMGELRKELDLFDRIGGGGPASSRTVAPGRAEPISMTLPAAVTSISIVGVRVELTEGADRTEFSAPGRPVAIASNLRIAYTPAPVGK